MRKTTQLKTLLHSDKLEFLMEAHNALGARIVEEAGFRGIWGSGLAISASLGLRDNNEASWTQVLDVVEFMSDASNIPIMLDADTGYGNFNNVRRLVRKLEQRQVAGMCIEDKLFPKSNSFREGRPQPMAAMEEFVGKIKAAKDTQHDADFCVVARVEALIAGYGLEEALRRAHAYAEAGADGILIHSKLTTAFQILAFMEHWKENCPVVIVPTKYYTTPVEVFEEAGVSVVIWANHLMRSCIKAMQRVAGQIHRERSLVSVEPTIAPLDEVFRLQDEAELCSAEALYLPAADAVDGSAADRGRDAARIASLARVGTDVRAVPIA
jgi:phosphoenolpyruvate phosphomutase